MTTQNKRERLVDAAATLFHTNGLANTSLADIAKHADIPIGNVYYYFKTKEELAMAAIAKRREQFGAAYALLDESFDDPRQRLIEAVGYFDKVREEYTRFGCPIGKIIADTDTERDNVAKAAAQVLEDFVAWAERQFRYLGHASQARMYATSIMAAVQGATIMAKATATPNVMTEEMSRVVQWLQTLPNKRIQIGKVGMRTAEPAA